MGILLLLLAALLAYGAWEYRGHQKRLNRIPIRIHVNGSRGKSSVTRLIAAGLRAGGIRTYAKTTGTLPRIIDHEGKEIAIIRDQRPNIIEQIKIIRYMAKHNPEAIVIECMAVLPEYQWFCEHKMIRSTVGVITNCRLDHINEMGRFREQIAHSLANSSPLNGVLYTSEKTNLDVLHEVGRMSRTEVHRIGGGGVTDEELKRFSYIEHPANIGLSLAVCEKVGVSREKALQGMVTVTPDPGALRLALCREGEKEVLFVNALAANDPESTLEIYRHIEDRFGPLGMVVLMLNSRADRQDRSIQLIEMVAGNVNFEYIVLTGEKTQRFRSYLSRFKIPSSKTVILGWTRPEKVYEKLFSLVHLKGTVLAIGNVGAGGLDIFRYFYKRRLFPVGVSCQQCKRSLLDEVHTIDGYPSVNLNIAYDDKRGWLRLSSLYGSYNLELEHDLPAGAVVGMFCPHCGGELISDHKCSECGTAMAPMAMGGGGTVHICPRRGCKGHLLNV